MPVALVGKNVLIHAARAMTDRDFKAACEFAKQAGATMFPDPDKLKRGGIVGMVQFGRSTMLVKSKWFAGKWGWPIARPYPLPFRPCLGERGFFTPQFL